MKGFFNKLLRIDLTNRSFRYEKISDKLLKTTLGGKGLGVHYLLEENPVGVDPLSPEAITIIALGAASGTKVWGQSRFAVFAKSPATNGYGESYCGGGLTPIISSCGIDAIILNGRCDTLTYLKIEDEGVSFENAGAIQGKNTADSEDYILEHSTPGAGAMTIGPAGENEVRLACIKAEKWRSIGRGGMGAVFGSKNLKGISFFGSQKKEVADTELIKKVNKAVAKNGKASPVTLLYKQLGTPMMVAKLNAAHAFPTEYWKSGYFDKHENISSDYMQDNCDVKADGCPNCFLRCTKKTVVKQGRHTDMAIEGPEFETLYAIGGINKVEPLEEVIYLNKVCDELGLDTMSAGNMAGFAIEAYKRGKSDFEIDYNQPDKMVELFHMITERKGFGAILAKGIIEASKELDQEDIAIHVKGLEPSGYDPRTLKGMALSYATSARGACHLRGTFYKAELSGQIDKDQIEGKAELHIDYEDRSALFDCLILCRFFRDFTLWDEIGMIFEATTGLKRTKRELELLANDITQKTRIYNLREGVGPATDTLPKRFFKEATTEGESITEKDLNFMVNDYNKIRESRSQEFAR